MSWQTAFETRFGTGYLEAARRLHSGWKQQAASEAKKVKVSSLATRIRTLCKTGDSTGWWERHLLLRRLFAQLIDVDPEAILGSRPTTVGELAFPEFPRLPPIPANAEPFSIAGRGWLLHVALHLHQRADGAKRVWVQAPAGAGKSLVVRCLQTRHSSTFHAVTVPSVSAAAAHATVSLPLVVEIEAPHPEDLTALEALTAREQPTVVLAPFPLPVVKTAWSGRTMGRSAWVTSGTKWDADWRPRMLEWIDSKLEESDRDTRLVMAEVLDWLKRHDPRGVLIATPGDLLALCADFDAHGTDEADLVRRSRRWLEEVGVAMLPADAPSTWRNHAATATYREVVRAHLRAVGQEFGTLDAETWAALIPQRVAPGPCKDVPGATLALGYLQDAGLVRGACDGLVPYPAWVAQGIVTGELHSDFEKPHVAAWGALAADLSRQPLVDAALDALSPGALWALARSAAKHGTGSTLAELGAIESVLAALGRRLSDPAFPLRERDISPTQQLTRLQIKALVPDPGHAGSHHPFTRRDVDEWFATGWAVSLRTPAPENFEREGGEWELPGWSTGLNLSSVAPHGFPSSTVMPAAASVNVQRLVAMTSMLVEKLVAGDVPIGVPRLLLPALILSEGGWTIGSKHFAHFGGTWEEGFLVSAAAALSPERRELVAARIWALVAASVVEDGAVPVAERIEVLRRNHRGLASFVLSNLSAAELARTAREFGIHRASDARNRYPSDPLQLLALPRATRQAALRAWLDTSGTRAHRWVEAAELVPLLDAEDIDVALELVAGSGRDVASQFTSFVWRTSPSRAHEAIRVALDKKLRSAEAWFYDAPRVELPTLLKLVSELPTRPDWLKEWATRRVLDGGAVAEELFHMASQP